MRLALAAVRSPGSTAPAGCASGRIRPAPSPGPACYGRGGSEATVTDASVVLGCIDPGYFAGGSVTLAPELALDSDRASSCAPAWPVSRAGRAGYPSVLNAQMVEAIRLVSIGRGSIRAVTPGAAGRRWADACHGAGRRTGDRQRLLSRAIPACCRRRACSPHRWSTRSPLRSPARWQVPHCRCTARLDELDRQCARMMAEEAVDATQMSVQVLRRCLVYWSVVSSGSADGRGRADPLGMLYRDFLVLHDRIYGHATEQPASIVNLRTVHRAGGSDRLNEGDYRPTEAAATKPPRAICVAGIGAPVPAAVLQRPHCRSG